MGVAKNSVVCFAQETGAAIRGASEQLRRQSSITDAIPGIYVR